MDPSAKGTRWICQERKAICRQPNQKKPNKKDYHLDIDVNKFHIDFRDEKKTAIREMVDKKN